MSLEQAREWLRSATAVAVLTGAGISAESGIPTFRGTGGLWRDYKPEDLATPEAFARDPRLVWEWYNWRRAAIQQAKPNAGHAALVRLEIQKPHFTLITQNVDGLHDMAGSGRILKLHGDIWRMRCTSCGSNWPDRRGPLPKLPPHRGCGGVGRPRAGRVWRASARRHDAGSRTCHSGGAGSVSGGRFGAGLSGGRPDSPGKTSRSAGHPGEPGTDSLFRYCGLRARRSGGRVIAAVDHERAIAQLTVARSQESEGEECRIAAVVRPINVN